MLPLPLLATCIIHAGKFGSIEGKKFKNFFILIKKNFLSVGLFVIIYP